MNIEAVTLNNLDHDPIRNVLIQKTRRHRLPAASGTGGSDNPLSLSDLWGPRFRRGVVLGEGTLNIEAVTLNNLDHDPIRNVLIQKTRRHRLPAASGTGGSDNPLSLSDLWGPRFRRGVVLGEGTLNIEAVTLNNLDHDPIRNVLIQKTRRHRLPAASGTGGSDNPLSLSDLWGPRFRRGVVLGEGTLNIEAVTLNNLDHDPIRNVLIQKTRRHRLPAASGTGGSDNPLSLSDLWGPRFRRGVVLGEGTLNIEAVTLNNLDHDPIRNVLIQKTRRHRLPAASGTGGSDNPLSLSDLWGPRFRRGVVLGEGTLNIEAVTLNNLDHDP